MVVTRDRHVINAVGAVYSVYESNPCTLPPPPRPTNGIVGPDQLITLRIVDPQHGVERVALEVAVVDVEDQAFVGLQGEGVEVDIAITVVQRIDRHAGQ